ncbi:NADH-quinone oxidoreductase subunit NuoB [Hahella sp. SMD15-11]|uniref:NADH-quinone oxidoreductase subunit NuoB n=1 Tax=Thermohahella caldifontis TaxID=3142973 RepID=A0AB39V1F6_9GAMM
MYRVLRKIFSTGIVTEPVERDATFEALGQAVKRGVDRHFQGALNIRQVDAGSCNGCELEIHALNNPFYDIERFGIHFVASPRHADLLLVTGPVTRHMEAALRLTWEAAADPKWVIAAGSCAAGEGIYDENYACVGAVSKVIPVDLVIPGCPPTPEMLLKGILALMESPAMQRR